MHLATTAGHESIAFPSLGTGANKYPPQVSAEATLAAIVEFVRKNPSSSITNVAIVIYYKDEGILQVDRSP